MVKKIKRSISIYAVIIPPVTMKERQSQRLLRIGWYIIAVPTCLGLAYLNYEQEILVPRRLKENLTLTPRVTEAAEGEEIQNPTQIASSKTPLPTSFRKFVIPPGWECGMVNNPDNLSFEPAWPEAPTASHVLVLPGVGEAGYDNPPYLLIHWDGSSEEIPNLEGLNLVFNGEIVCVKAN